MRRSIFALAAAGLFLSASAQSASFVLQAAKWGPSQDNAVARAGGSVTFSNGAAGIASVQSSNPSFLQAVLAGGAIQSGAQDMEVQWTAPLAIEPLPDTINPNDDRFFKNVQWAPQSVEAPAAWAAGYTGLGVRVAVIDGGIYNAHRDLAGAIDVASSRSFVDPGTGSDAACRAAFNCDTGTFWHATHVSGIIAARDNTIGIVGIAPQATIVGVKALHSGSGTFGAVINAILYAATDGHADIINMSLGAEFNRNETGAAELVSALNRAVNFAAARGVLVVVAAGNSGLDLDHTGNVIATPAESGNALAVAATGPVGFALGATNFSRPASYTNFGTSAIWVAAPGGDAALPGNDICTLPTTTVPTTNFCWVFDLVLSTARGPAASTNSYAFAAGTSMATPAAAAVAALIKQKYPGISVGDLKNRLAQSATDEGKVGQDPFYGRGYVNARNAVTN